MCSLENSWNKKPLFPEGNETGSSSVDHCGGRGGERVLTVGSLPGGGGGDWRPEFLARFGTPLSADTPTLDAPQSCIPESVRTYFSFPGNSQGFAALPWGIPLYFFWLLPRYACSPGEALETWRLRAVPVRRRRLGSGSSHHCLCSAMCAKRFLANWGPLLAHPLADMVPLLPSCWATHPPL